MYGKVRDVLKTLTRFSSRRFFTVTGSLDAAAQYFVSAIVLIPIRIGRVPYVRLTVAGGRFRTRNVVGLRRLGGPKEVVRRSFSSVCAAIRSS